MVKFISIGEYNHNYKYMLFYIISKMINVAIISLEYQDLYKPIKNKKPYTFINNHPFINDILWYLLAFLLSFAMIKYEYLNKQNEKKSHDNYSIELIYKRSIFNETKLAIFVVLVSILLNLQDLLTQFLEKISSLDLWTLEIIISYFIGLYFYKIQIYSHQKLSIYIISIFCTSLLLVSLILTYKYSNDNSVYKDNYHYIPIGIIISIVSLIIRIYSTWKAKELMDLKFISIAKLQMNYGLFGVLISTIASIITTYVKCPNSDLCENEKDGHLYFESFKTYFKDLSNLCDSWKNSIINVLIILIYIITYFLRGFFYMLTIKYLTPFHIFALPAIYYLIIQIILIIYNSIINELKMNSYKIVKSVILSLVDIFCFLSILVFLEFIELHFCKLDYNLRRNIIRRALDQNLDEETDSELEDDEEQICNELPNMNKNSSIL